jgi:hypothetical protein
MSKNNKNKKGEVYPKDVFYHPQLEYHSDIQDIVNEKIDKGIKGSYIVNSVTVYPYWVD